MVGNLAETLRTPFEGDLLDAITTFERKIMIYEAQSRETNSDSLKIACVIAGMGQSCMKEHLLLSATKCDSWSSNFEAIVHAKKTISAPIPREIDAFQGGCHKRGKYGHVAKECRSSVHGREASKSAVWKRHHGQCWIRINTSSHKDSQKGRWKGGRKGDGKGTQKGGKPKRGKGGTQGNGVGKGKKGQRLNKLREPPEEQWASGS